MGKRDFHKELKTGFTTGTCSAAVAKACVHMLVHQELVHHIEVTMPDGSVSTLEICNPQYNHKKASCFTIKDAGDDPDITHGIQIFAEASFTEEPGIKLNAGKGIGTVTKPGLAVEVGQPAINPVPRKIILQAISEALPENKGIEVEISIPDGVEIAKKTFNPQLGIVDGISVLGTTGIVKPMSEEALKSSLDLSLSQLASFGHDEVVLVPGNYAVSFLKKYYQVPEEQVVQTSNFIGYMLERAVKHGFKKVLLVGHIGKLVKLAGGIFYTHSRIADCRNEILSAHYLKYANDIHTASQLMQVNTTEEAIDKAPDPSFWNYLSNEIQKRATLHIYNELEIEVITFSQTHGLLGKSKNADEHLKTVSPLPIEKQNTSASETEITICGIGPGNPAFIIQQVYAEIAKADVIIAGKRHLELVSNNQKKKLEFNGRLEELKKQIIKESPNKICLLVSGDTGFYSLRRFIVDEFPQTKINCIPGISSFQYLYAKQNMSYENAKLASLHGKEFYYLEALSKYDSVFLLTDYKNNAQSIANELIKNQLEDIQMIVGCNLSYDDEFITKGTAKEIAEMEIPSKLCSIILIHQP